MDFFDGSLGMWIQIAKYGAFAMAVSYGTYRRWYMRLWPLLTLGLILDVSTQLIFTDSQPHGVGYVWGMVFYPIYCVLGGMAGVGIGAFIEWRCPRLLVHGIDAPDLNLYKLMEEAAKRQSAADQMRLQHGDPPPTPPAALKSANTDRAA